MHDPYEQIVIYRAGTMEKTAEISINTATLPAVKKLLLRGYACAYGPDYRAKVAQRKSKDEFYARTNLGSDRSQEWCQG